MKCIALVAVVIVALAATAVQSSIVPLIGAAGGLLLPPLSYTAQTVDLGGGVQGTVVAGQPARLLTAGPAVLTAGGLLGGQTVITSAGTIQLAGAPAAVQLAGVPAAIQLATGLPAGIQLAGLPAAIQVAPAVVPIVQAEA